MDHLALITLLSVLSGALGILSVIVYLSAFVLSSTKLLARILGISAMTGAIVVAVLVWFVGTPINDPFLGVLVLMGLIFGAIATLSPVNKSVLY